MADIAQLPPIVPRPELARWIWDRNIKLAEAGLMFGCSHEQVRLMCLPFADPRRRVPDADLLARIICATGGEIGLVHFYPPELRPGGASEILRLARAS